MTNFENMTATAQVARSRAATLVPPDASWIDFAPMGSSCIAAGIARREAFN